MFNERWVENEMVFYVYNTYLSHYTHNNTFNCFSTQLQGLVCNISSHGSCLSLSLYSDICVIAHWIKKTWVVKCVNYWMKLSGVCVWLYSKLCHAAHAPLHPFTGRTSLRCADLEHSNWERSKHTHKAQLHTETCIKHTHSLMHGFLHRCTHTVYK